MPPSPPFFNEQMTAEEARFFMSMWSEAGEEYVDSILGAMARFPDDARVTYGASIELGYLAETHPENQDSIREFGGVPLTCGAMARFPDDAEVAVGASIALANLAANNPANRDAIREAGGVPLLRHAATLGGNAATFANIALQRMGE